MSDADLQVALNNLPLNRPTEFDGNKICLQLFPDGAVLSVELIETYSPAALQGLLEQGFSWALLFEAGIALDATGNRLLLTQWLPHAQSWHAAELALEQLLNQIDLCRSLLGNTFSEPQKGARRSRDGLRFRAMLSR